MGCAASPARLRRYFGWAISTCLLLCSVAALMVATLALVHSGNGMIGNALFLVSCIFLAVCAGLSFSNPGRGLLGVQWSVAASAATLFLTTYAQSDSGLTLSFGGQTRYVHVVLPLLAIFFVTFLLARLGRPAPTAACHCG